MELLMNDTSNPNPSRTPGESQPEGTTNPQSSSQPGRCVLEPLCSAVKEGAYRAKAAAEKAIPKIKAAVSGATYWLGYGVSFSTVFSYTVVKELAPEVLKAGCRDGAQAGRKTAEDFASELKARPHAPAVTPPPGTDSSRPATQPAAA